MKYNILFLLLLFAIAEATNAQVQTTPSASQNYIKTRTYTHEVAYLNYIEKVYM